MAKQFVYSSSPHNLDGNSGWGILTKSLDLQLDCEQFRQIQDFVVKPYSGNVSEDVEKPRQSFSFFKAGGCWLLECSTATGRRWYLGDNRVGEYVAHVYVFDALEDDFSPFAYLNSDGFWKEIPAEWKEKAKEISMMDSPSSEKRYPPVPTLPERLEVKDSHYEFAEILERVPDAAVPEIGKILETVASRLNSPSSASCLVFDANSTATIDTMALISQLFPRGDRTRLQFSTFLNEVYADCIPTFNELAFYGTVRDGDSDVNTGLFDGMTFVSCRYPLELKNKEDIKVFKKIVDDLETGGNFEDAARRFVIRTTNVENLSNLLKGHLDDADKLVAEIDAHFLDKKALYNIFKDVKAIPVNIKIAPEWFKAVSAAQMARSIVFEPGCINLGKTTEYQEAYKILGGFDEKSAELLGVWFKIAGLFKNPKELGGVVQELEKRENYDSALRPTILGVMQEATADMPLEEFVELNAQQSRFGHEVLLRGLKEREQCAKEKLDGLRAEKDNLQMEKDNLMLKLRFAKIVFFLLLFVFLLTVAVGLWALL